MSEHLRQTWAGSRLFRAVLVLTLTYALLRLTAHGIYLATLLAPDKLPNWAAAEQSMVPVDLQTYLDAAERFLRRQPLYPAGPIEHLEGLYQYSPFFAVAFTPFLWLTPSAVAIVHTVLHLLAYVALYVLWYRIFRRLRLRQTEEMMAWTLPVWLVFSPFWSDLGYLNVYIVMALLATLLIDAMIQEHLGRAVLWLTIIVTIKPMWAFAAVVPLLTGRRKFFLMMVALAILAQAAIAGVTTLMGGADYVCQQYADYIRFLARLSQDFPWRGPESGFLGYNHSIRQTVLFFIGITPAAWWIATGIKWALLMPLGVVALRLRARTEPIGSAEVLELAFALYLGVFIWLDMVWEVSLGIAVFVYLLATEPRRALRALMWGTFIPYALVDFWQLVSFAALGESAMIPGPYFVTDPSIYIPMVMIVILVLYGLLMERQLVGSTARKGRRCSIKTRRSQPL